MTLRKANTFLGSNSQYKQPDLTWDGLENSLNMTMFESTGFFKSHEFPNYDMKPIMELPATFSTGPSNYF